METISTSLTYPRSRAKSGAAQTLSQPTSAWAVIKATVIKELRMAKRYALNLVGEFADLGIRIGFYLLLAGVASFRSPGMLGGELTDHDLFIFFQAGLLLMVFSGPTLWGPIHAVRNDLFNGTLEFLYSSPGSRYAYYTGTVLAKVLINMVLFLPVYVGLVVWSDANLVDTLMILLTCVTMLVALMAMGIAFSLLVLIWRQADTLVGVLNLMFEMLTGAYIPVATFPKVIQYFTYFLPHTWGYDLIRYYAFDGSWQTLLPVWQEWTIIVLFAVVFTLASRYLLGKAERLAKRSGLHVI